MDKTIKLGSVSEPVTKTPRQQDIKQMVNASGVVFITAGIFIGLLFLSSHALCGSKIMVESIELAALDQLRPATP